MRKIDILRYERASHARDYFSAVRSRYREHRNIDFFMSDLDSSLRSCLANPHQHAYFLRLVDSGALKAHLALVTDSRLGPKVAMFGFCFFGEDTGRFHEIWDRLIGLARSKGIGLIRGPINGSIWHPYRLVCETDGSDLFKTEPLSSPGEYEYLTALKPAREIRYHSGYRKNFDLMIDRTEPPYNNALNRGFIVERKKRLAPDELGRIIDLSREIFKNSWGYTDPAESDFVSKYNLDGINDQYEGIYQLKKNRSLIGYCSTIREDPETLILKTIAVRPGYRKAGLGNALVHVVHRQAREKNMKKIIYSLIKDDNAVRHFPRDDAVLFRRYSCFEFTAP